jgi:hypothetical protein
VSAVVGGIPPTALSRGVYTEQSLRERFTRVETVARRVGAIGDDGGSLLRPVLFCLWSPDNAKKQCCGSGSGIRCFF